MPLRFRKIFKIAPGFRINLSKRGFSTSIGKPGGTLNIGKNGIRPTVGIPGTGLSFTPSQSNAKSTASASGLATNVIIFIVSLLLICIISACCIGVIFSDTGEGASTPTVEATQNISIIIANTSSAAQTQTMISAPPTSTPFILDTPTMLPPVTLAPTWTAFPTDTPLVLSTLNVLPGLPNSGVCSCAGDTLNCSDFSTHNSAQACFASCTAQGVGDIHKLDQNNDGLACESLP